MKLANSSHKGKLGERVAENYLSRLGYRIVATNYKAAGAEIDIVAFDGDDLVVVEVKSRKHSEETLGEQIDGDKKQRIERAAEAYLSRLAREPANVRLEIVVVLSQQGVVHHFREEFFDF